MDRGDRVAFTRTTEADLNHRNYNHKEAEHIWPVETN